MIKSATVQGHAWILGNPTHGGDSDVNIRLAEHADVEELVRIWHDGWHDAHADIVPSAMTLVRTVDNFQQRVADSLPAWATWARRWGSTS